MAGFRADYAVGPEVRAQPVTPERDLDRTISHLLMTAEINAGHLQVHADAAMQSAGDPVLQAHHIHHAAGHVQAVSEHLAKLRDAVARRVPGVARELASLDRAIPGLRSNAYPVPRAALDMSIAHDLSSSQVAAGHVDRHLAEAAASAGDKASVKHNLVHAVHHISEIAHGLSELDEDLIRRLPPVGEEKARLLEAIAPPPGTTAPVAPGPDVADRSGPQPA